MRNYERLGAVAFLGAIVAYLAGMAVGSWTGDTWAAATVTFVLSVVASYLGWTWARREIR